MWKVQGHSRRILTPRSRTGCRMYFEAKLVSGDLVADVDALPMVHESRDLDDIVDLRDGDRPDLHTSPDICTRTSSLRLLPKWEGCKGLVEKVTNMSISPSNVVTDIMLHQKWSPM